MQNLDPARTSSALWVGRLSAPLGRIGLPHSTVMSTQGGVEDLVQWAEKEAHRLRGEATHVGLAHGALGLSHAAAALEFLRRHAPGSHFLSSAERLFQKEAALTASPAIKGTADILDAWARSTTESWAESLPFEVQSRIEAATDLMEQVQQLLDDPKVHPAAPVVLAGAALEEFLRSRINAKGLTPNGKPGINAYASALQTEGDLSRQEVKEITAWAGRRNDAAHGDFSHLSRDSARLMVDGINLFLQKRT